MSSFKRKFTLGYMALLIVFIIAGIFMIIFSSNNETPEIDESQIDKTPGLGTMLQIQDILTQQQLQHFYIYCIRDWDEWKHTILVHKNRWWKCERTIHSNDKITNGIATNLFLYRHSYYRSSIYKTRPIKIKTNVLFIKG